MGIQRTTHKSNYTMETMSKLQNIDKLTKGMFPLPFKIIDRYNWDYPSLHEKLNCAKYKGYFFHGGRNTIKLVTYKNKIVILQKLQRYVVNWYHVHILHPGMDLTDEMVFQHL